VSTGDERATPAAPGWYADPTDPTDPTVRRWWDGARWTDYVHRPGNDEHPSTSVEPATARPPRRRTTILALSVVATVIVALVAIAVTAHSGSGDASPSGSPDASRSHLSSVSSPSTDPRCLVVPQTRTFSWSGPPLSSFVGVAVPGSQQRAGTEVCETQSNNVVYHVDISAVALHTADQRIGGTTRVEFGGTVAFVSQDATLTTWMFERGGYSGEVFFQAVGPPTVALPSRQDTEKLIELVLETEARRDG
jgi:hypothetical protein